MIDSHIALAFDDVRLEPQYFDGESRKDVDVNQKWARIENTMLPFIASPMDTVSGSEMAIELYQMKSVAIIHRYNSVALQSREVKEASQERLVGAAVGVSGDYFERAQEVVKAGAKIICVDVAHGHSALMNKALTKLRGAFPNLHIMAGNVATPEAYYDLSKWGADSVRVGIGSGSICSTTIQTGCGKPLFQSLIDIAKARRVASKLTPQAQVIADGGIRCGGDVVKALAAGADFVMLGSLFAGTDEAPGEIFEEGGRKWKKYRGMASTAAQIEWRGFYSSDEGVEARVPYRGPVGKIIEGLENYLRTGLTYNGAHTITELQNKAKFIHVSTAAATEARPHILER